MFAAQSFSLNRSRGRFSSPSFIGETVSFLTPSVCLVWWWFWWWFWWRFCVLMIPDSPGLQEDRRLLCSSCSLSADAPQQEATNAGTTESSKVEKRGETHLLQCSAPPLLLLLCSSSSALPLLLLLYSSGVQQVFSSLTEPAGGGRWRSDCVTVASIYGSTRTSAHVFLLRSSRRKFSSVRTFPHLLPPSLLFLSVKRRPRVQRCSRRRRCSGHLLQHVCTPGPPPSLLLLLRRKEGLCSACKPMRRCRLLSLPGWRDDPKTGPNQTNPGGKTCRRFETVRAAKRKQINKNKICSKSKKPDLIGCCRSCDTSQVFVSVIKWKDFSGLVSVGAPDWWRFCCLQMNLWPRLKGAAGCFPSWVPEQKRI